jgi:predicted AAA+ superfamily ATPase
LNQTLEVDIPVFAGMNVSTARKLKQLLYIVAQSVPFKPNINKIAGMINVHRNQINDYFHYMEKVVSSLRGRSPKQSGERDVVIRLLQPSASQ